MFSWRRDFYVSRIFGVGCSLIKLPNESGNFIKGFIYDITDTNLFTVNNTNQAIVSFFCKLNSVDGGTTWNKQPQVAVRASSASISILEKLPDGNILCTTDSHNNKNGYSEVFTINSQGVKIKTNYQYYCGQVDPNNQNTYCYPPPYNGIGGNDGVIFINAYYIQKICPKGYQGILKTTKFYCNSSTISDTIIVPNDNEFTYQWKRDGSVISGATSPKYLATQLGKYTVAIFGKTCTGFAETDTITLALATSQTIVPKLTSITDSTICQGDTAKMTLVNGCNYSFLQWQKDGVDISGETSLNYKTTLSGVYKVKVTTSGVASYTNTKTVTINTSCCIMKSIANGSWESPSTWSCSRVPNLTDDVIINGHQINITTNTAKAKKVVFQGGRINMANSTAKLLIQNN